MLKCITENELLLLPFQIITEHKRQNIGQTIFKFELLGRESERIKETIENYFKTTYMINILKYLLIPLCVMMACSSMIAQNDGDAAFAKSICGTYSGTYMTKKSTPKSGAIITLAYAGNNKIKVEGSDYGDFEFIIKDISSDTLHLTSNVEGMKIKYTKSSRRIYINAGINGITTIYNGKFRYTDQDDLKKKQMRFDSLSQHKTVMTKSYGTYFGTLFFTNTGKTKQDTVHVTDYNIDTIEGNFQIQYKMAKILSSGANFLPIDTRIEYFTSNKTIKQAAKSKIKLHIDLENKVLRFEDRAKRIRFEGIRIDN